ncbi:MAG: PorV/PorQ family protein [Bacteroidota bacterium]
MMLSQRNPTTATDAFLSSITDARAAGQGDIGVATSSDAFSQYWNPSKYIFSNQKNSVGVTTIMGNKNSLNGLSQLNVIFAHKLNNRNAYAFGVRNYAQTIDQFISSGILQATQELAIEGSYALRLAEEFAMAVGGRFISLMGKAPLIASFNGDASVSLYGIDVSGYYHGKEKAYRNYNGRWRAGFNFSNLRGNSLEDNTDIEIYAPSHLKVGIGFDFIFDPDNLLAITSEYKTLLNSYTENADGERLNYVLEGSVAALGLEYSYREKLITRIGYSHGINRPTDTLASLGLGFDAKYAVVDVAFLFGLSEEENPIRQKVRVSLNLNIDDVF